MCRCGEDTSLADEAGRQIHGRFQKVSCFFTILSKLEYASPGHWKKLSIKSCFSRYSDKLGFRERSENAEIATELSLQPWRAFQPDGVIMFSDILTPLPALGIEFDIIKGTGPKIMNPVNRCNSYMSSHVRLVLHPDSLMSATSTYWSCNLVQMYEYAEGGRHSQHSPSSWEI